MAPASSRLRRATRWAARFPFVAARVAVLTGTWAAVIVFLYWHMLRSLRHEPEPVPEGQGARSKPDGVDGTWR